MRLAFFFGVSVGLWFCIGWRFLQMESVYPCRLVRLQAHTAVLVCEEEK